VGNSFVQGAMKLNPNLIGLNAAKKMTQIESDN
jgi:hypothetical protein